MYFIHIKQGDEHEIDGVKYKISMPANVENFNCRSALFEIHGAFEENKLSMDLTPENFQTWKKELQKAIKSWDGCYNKHIKTKIYDEMAAIHTAAMAPLTALIKSNRAFHQLEIMMKDDKSEVPLFRFKALEEQFCKNMSVICELMKLYGEDRIEAHYDIRQQLETLKIHNWENIIPFAYYLNPLKATTNDVRKELMDMHDRGELLIKYEIELNEELKKTIKAMLQADRKAQLLVGNSLKQDQFKFFYDTCNCIYNSVLRVKLCNSDEKVCKDVIPLLVAFKSLMHIRDIQLAKASDALKAKEKAERTGKPPGLEPEEE